MLGLDTLHRRNLRHHARALVAADQRRRDGSGSLARQLAILAASPVVGADAERFTQLCIEARIERQNTRGL